MRKHISPFVVLLIAGAAFCLFWVTPALTATSMPTFTLEDVTTGKTVDSRSFRGTSLLITFFATWCPPCLQEVPNLIKLQQHYKEAKFSVVGLSVDQERSDVRNLVARQGINYPVMMADAGVTRKFGGVFGIPTSFLVNAKGLVVKKYTGYISYKELVRDIELVVKSRLDK